MPTTKRLARVVRHSAGSGSPGKTLTPRQDERKRRRRRIINEVVRAAILLAIVGGSALSSVFVARLTLMSPPPATPFTYAIGQAGPNVVAVHREIRGLDQQLSFKLAPGTDKFAFSISQLSEYGFPGRPVLIQQQLQCWTQTAYQSFSTVRTGYAATWVRNPHVEPPPSLVPGREPFDPCPIDSAITVGLDDSAKVSVDFDHMYVRFPNVYMTLALPLGSPDAIDTYANQLTADYALNASQIVDEDGYLPTGYRVEATGIETPPNECIVTGQDLGQPPSGFHCETDSYRGDYWSSESPEANVDVPKVTADYVDPNYDNLRELLLIVLGAIVALGLSAFLALILPRNARI